ncbi:hypothetical protein VYU27_001334 [Nannochloropsis oceanica]
MPSLPGSPTTIIFLAFGTRGDVQPLALLAAALATVNHHHIRFISHAQHESILQELWAKSTTAIDFFVPSPSPPHAANVVADNSIDSTLRPRAHLEVCIKTVEQVLKLSSTSSPLFPGQVLLIANLFALEAVHLAEVFDLPLIMAHPFPAPASFPFNFKAQFRRADPLQYKCLRENGRGEGGREGGQDEATVRGDERMVSWKDVEHWLWPAFADSWSSFRCMLLGFDEESEGCDELPLPWLAGRPAIPLLYLYSESIMPRPQFFPEHAHVVGYMWPEEIRESYIPSLALAAFLAGGAAVGKAKGGGAASPAASATTAGLVWKDEDRDMRPLATPTPVASTRFFLPAAGPILFTFGTMISLGALGNLTRAATTVVEAVLSFPSSSSSSSFSSSSSSFLSSSCSTSSTTILKMQPAQRCVIDAAGSPSWAAALREALSAHQQRQEAQQLEHQEGGQDNRLRVFILEETVPHSWLLPQCSVVVHHGGSGTTAAALRAGIAQVTVPAMMDQFQWAERVAWLDLGPSPLSLARIFPHDDGEGEDGLETEKSPSCLLSKAINQASHPPCRLRAAAAGRRLRAEPSGATMCINVIHAHLEEWKGFFRSSINSLKRPSLPVPLPAGCEFLTLGLFEGDDMNESMSNNERIQKYETNENNCDDAKRATVVATAASSALTIVALQGSESEVAFIHQEIFPPPRRQESRGWGYLKHGVHVKEGDVILDIGANIGLFALYLDLYVMEEPEQIFVLAVEPAPSTFAALQYNLAAHGVKVVACVQQAVGAGTTNTISDGPDQDQEAAPSKGMLRFFPHAPGNSSLFLARNSSAGGKNYFQGLNPRLRAHLEKGVEDMLVEMTTISALVCNHSLSRVDLLKVDVEGSEEMALKGIDEKTWPLIRQVVMEVHNFDGREERIDAVLRSKGFGKVVWETPQWTEGDGGVSTRGEVNNRMVFACRT